MRLEFKNYLLQTFRATERDDYCQEKVESFVDFLLDHNLIDTQNIKRFTILKEFDIQYPLHRFHKTKTVYTIANKYGLSERTVWTVLKDHVRRFERKNSFSSE